MDGSGEDRKDKTFKEGKSDKRMGMRALSGALLLILSIGMIAFGVLREETTEVFRKAVQICLECIGLG